MQNKTVMILTDIPGTTAGVFENAETQKVA